MLSYSDKTLVILHEDNTLMWLVYDGVDLNVMYSMNADIMMQELGLECEMLGRNMTL
jgi:hypothetical protein